MPIKKDKKTKKIVVKKTSTKGKTSQSQSITVNIQKGKSAPKQPSGKPTIASSIASLANVIRAQDFYRPPAIPVAPVSMVPQTIKTSIPEPVAIKTSIPEPVAIKIPVRKSELELMAEEEKLSSQNIRHGPALKPKFEGTSSKITTIKVGGKKAPASGIAPVEKTVGGFSVGISDISTTPLYEGGREVPEPSVKRPYKKSGKYSKKGTPTASGIANIPIDRPQAGIAKERKLPSLIPVVMGEEKDTFYPTKPPAEVLARFGEPDKYAIYRPQAELPEPLY